MSFGGNIEVLLKPITGDNGAMSGHFKANGWPHSVPPWPNNPPSPLWGHNWTHWSRVGVTIRPLEDAMRPFEDTLEPWKGDLKDINGHTCQCFFRSVRCFLCFFPYPICPMGKVMKLWVKFAGRVIKRGIAGVGKNRHVQYFQFACPMKKVMSNEKSLKKRLITIT